MEKKILITINPQGAMSVTTEGIETLPEMLGILEMVKAGKINESFGIKPYVSPIHKLKN